MRAILQLVAAMCFLSSLAPSVKAGDGCFASWADAAAVVIDQKLVGVEALANLGRDDLNGRIVRSTLCSEGGRYIYRLVVRGSDGGLRNVVVDARRPFSR